MKQWNYLIWKKSLKVSKIINIFVKIINLINMDTTHHGIVTDKDKDVAYLKSIEVHPVKNQEYGYDATLEELKKVEGVTIIHSDATLQRIVAKVDSYDASCRIGSKHWCISSVTYGGSLGNANGIMYWNVYLGNEEHRQYFVWDFKQPSTSFVLVGTTTHEDKGTFYCGYNYPNHSFSMEDYIKENKWDRSIFFKNDLVEETV